MAVSVVEVRGLLSADEMNVRDRKDTQLDTYVEVKIEDNKQQSTGKTFKTQNIKGKRSYIYGYNPQTNDSEFPDQTFELGQVNHSGYLQHEQVKMR